MVYRREDEIQEDNNTVRVKHLAKLA